MPTPRRPLLAGAATAAMAVAAVLVGAHVASSTEGDTVPALTRAMTPDDVSVDAAGNLYISDIAHHEVLKVTPDGDVTTLAGTGEPDVPVAGPAHESPLLQPSGVAVSPDGASVFVTDRIAEVVVEIDTVTGDLGVVAGVHPTLIDPGAPVVAPKPGPATSSGLFAPSGLALDAEGDLYIADTYNALVERVGPDGALSFVAGVPNTLGPPPGWSDPVPADRVTMHLPSDVAVDGDGNVFIADTGNNVVTRVSTEGSVRVVAGTGEDGVPSPGDALWTDLGDVTGVAVGPDGDLYIADPTNDRVLRVDFSGVDQDDLGSSGALSVVAGNGERGAPVEGPATESPLHGPSSVDVDADGNVYIADTSNHRVLKVDTDGDLSVVAGSGVGAPIRIPIGEVSVVNLPAEAQAGESFQPIVQPVVGEVGGSTSVASETPEVCVVTDQPVGPMPGLVDDEYADIEFIDIVPPDTEYVPTVELLSDGECRLVATVEEGEYWEETEGEPQTLVVGDPPPANTDPVADAGDDQEVVERLEATLDGSGSSDPDGDDLTYSWARTAGPEVTLAGGDTAAPTFVVPDAPATLELELTVTDEHGASSTDTVTVTSLPRFTPDEAWVDHTYRVLLGRPSDAGGRAFWVGRLESGTPRAVAARSIGLSSEAARGRVLDQRYQAWLGRRAEPAARTYWSSRLLAGMPITALEGQILGSPELFVAAGGTNAAYVARLYEVLLGRPAGDDERAFWSARVPTAGRAAVAMSILRSGESERRRVGAEYERILHRPADAGGLAHWVGVLDATGDLRRVEIGLAAAWVNRPGSST